MAHIGIELKVNQYLSERPRALSIKESISIYKYGVRVRRLPLFVMDEAPMVFPHLPSLFGRKANQVHVLGLLEGDRSD